MVIRVPLVLGERQETVKEISSRRDGEVPGSMWGNRYTEEESAGRGMQRKCRRGRMVFMYGCVSS